MYQQIYLNQFMLYYMIEIGLNFLANATPLYALTPECVNTNARCKQPSAESFLLRIGRYVIPLNWFQSVLERQGMAGLLALNLDTTSSGA